MPSEWIGYLKMITLCINMIILGSVKMITLCINIVLNYWICKNDNIVYKYQDNFRDNMLGSGFRVAKYDLLKIVC